MIIKIVAAIIPAFCVSLCFFLLHRDPKPEEKTLIAEGWAKPFSVTEYLDRMERESLKLAERRKKYLIVLWWGFDGLRLNEDGTTEWISRKPTSTPPPQIDYSMCNTIVTQSGLQNDICNAESIAQAKTQLQTAQLQAIQTAQIQNMINCIRQAPYPAYLSYPSQCCITTYTPNYWTYPGGCFGTYQS